MRQAPGYYQCQAQTSIRVRAARPPGLSANAIQANIRPGERAICFSACPNALAG
jgi:hypothetical protein